MMNSRYYFGPPVLGDPVYQLLTYKTYDNIIMYWLIQNDVAKYGNYVRKFMWQLCEWGTVNI
jgi:hypothetical protein